MFRPKSLVKIIIIIVLIVVGFFIFLGKNESANFNLQYRDINFEKIEFEGNYYSIINGRVIGGVTNEKKIKIQRLVEFYQWNKEDPLFDSPDIDPQSFINVVDSLNQANNEISKTVKRVEHLGPSDFLNAMGRAITVNREFLIKPSDILAKQLLAVQKQTANFYLQESTNILSVINPPLDVSPASFGIVTTSQIVVSDFEKIIKNGKALLDEIEKRQNCLEVKGECLRPILTIKKPERLVPKSEKIPNFIPKEKLFSIKDPHRVTKAGDKMIDRFKGPYKVASPCFGWGENFSWPDYYFDIVTFERKNNNLLKFPIMGIKLATGGHFRKVSDDPGASLEEQKLYQQGFKYVPVGSISLYMCLYQGHIAELLEIYNFLLKNQPVFPNSEINAKNDIKLFFQEAKGVEEFFFNKQYQSYKELSNLADYYGFAYKLIAQSPDEDWAKNLSNQKEIFLERSIAIKRKLGRIHLFLINNLLSVNTLKKRLIVNSDQVTDSYIRGFLYTFRNAYGLVYFPFSQSVWRLNEDPEYLKRVIVKDTDGLDSQFLSYNKALEKYSEDEVQKWLSSDIDKILDDLIESKEATQSGSQ